MIIYPGTNIVISMYNHLFIVRVFHEMFTIQLVGYHHLWSTSIGLFFRVQIDMLKKQAETDSKARTIEFFGGFSSRPKNGGFHRGYTKIDGLFHGKSICKLMIWRYPHFLKYSCEPWKLIASLVLVGGLEHFWIFTFHQIWDVILPIDSYLSRWWN